MHATLRICAKDKCKIINRGQDLVAKAVYISNEAFLGSRAKARHMNEMHAIRFTQFILLNFYLTFST